MKNEQHMYIDKKYLWKPLHFFLSSLPFQAWIFETQCISHNKGRQQTLHIVKRTSIDPCHLNAEVDSKSTKTHIIWSSREIRDAKFSKEEIFVFSNHYSSISNGNPLSRSPNCTSMYSSISILNVQLTKSMKLTIKHGKNSWRYWKSAVYAPFI